MLVLVIASVCIRYQPLFTLTDIMTVLTSGVPQKVEVVPSGSIPSLHRPKSVNTTWPCKQRTQKRIFLTIVTKIEGFRVHNYKTLDITDLLESLKECSLVSDLYNENE